MSIKALGWPRLVVAIGVVALAVAACGGSAREGSGGGAGAGLNGTVKVDGSSTVAPLTTAASELFQEREARVQVTVGTSGTGGGFEKFCNGETDISDASRPIKDEEKAACQGKGVQYQEFPVAIDALTVVVHKDNDWATCLTTDQLKKIWEPGSTVKSWKDVDAKFPAEELRLFGPGTDSGTFDYFTDEINGAEGASRKDYSPSEDDNVTVQGVAGSKGGLGYFGFTYYEENQDKLKAVQIDDGDGCVTPSSQTAQSGEYKPLSRQIFIYPSVAAAKRPEVIAFLDFYVQNLSQIAKDAKYIPLPADQAQQTQTGLQQLKTQAGV